jgi:homogentisate 1,2-dioxygenase
MTDTLEYQSGFYHHFETEAEKNALVIGRNAPQTVPFGLYAEQLNGTAFTMPRAHNLFSWLYRIQPSVTHGEFKLVKQQKLLPPPTDVAFTPPTQMRWNPQPLTQANGNFIESLVTFAGNGSIESHTGAAIHLYCANQSMQQTYFYNADGEFLIVPQEGALFFRTEMGNLHVAPGEIIVIPRGVKFQVGLTDDKARGYVLENFGQPLRLPDLGLIGANGLANLRDFKTPIAAYEKKQGDFTLLAKFQGNLWSAPIQHSPLDVVAWHGNYAPYKYDLHAFNTMNSVSFDHPDPSIFTVLHSPSTLSGRANIDFVIFPARWMVATDTFRPPYFHRNIMSEYMGLIYGEYDAKQAGFLPGGGSLHNCMSAHGPDAEAYHKAIKAELKPEFYNNTLAFMFESQHVWRLTEAAYHSPLRQQDYQACWQGLQANFQI